MDERVIENMQFAVSRTAGNYEQKPLFACLFCGGAKPCENLRSTGVNALCLSWGQNTEKPKLAKIVRILDNLMLKSRSLDNAVVICFEHVTNHQRTGKEKRKIITT